MMTWPGILRALCVVIFAVTIMLCTVANRRTLRLRTKAFCLVYVAFLLSRAYTLLYAPDSVVHAVQAILMLLLLLPICLLVVRLLSMRRDPYDVMTTRKLGKGTEIGINLNTLIGGVGSLIGALILWFVQDAVKTSKANAASSAQQFMEQSKTLIEIKTQLPPMQTAISSVQADVKEQRQTMVTRNELNDKHERLLEDIQGVAKKQEQLEQKLDAFKQPPR